MLTVRCDITDFSIHFLYQVTFHSSGPNLLTFYHEKVWGFVNVGSVPVEWWLLVFSLEVTLRVPKFSFRWVQ